MQYLELCNTWSTAILEVLQSWSAAIAGMLHRVYHSQKVHPTAVSNQQIASLKKKKKKGHMLDVLVSDCLKLVGKHANKYP